ncbi:MAG: hypothetical protein LBU79_01830 [Planctomycetota bacterium]|jgi:hypothetical protein|nr:hypothetical protein [Planctomycetota bacterium]
MMSVLKGGFFVVDVISVLTERKDPRKHWTVLKTRLKASDPHLTTNCSQLKFTAKDGKERLTDCLMQDDVLALVKSVSGKKAAKFIKKPCQKKPDHHTHRRIHPNLSRFEAFPFKRLTVTFGGCMLVAKLGIIGIKMEVSAQL